MTVHILPYETPRDTEALSSETGSKPALPFVQPGYKQPHPPVCLWKRLLIWVLIFNIHLGKAIGAILWQVCAWGRSYTWLTQTQKCF